MTTPTTTVQILRPVSVSATAVRVTGQTASAELGVSGPDLIPTMTICAPDGSAIHVALDGGRLEPLIDTLRELASFLDADL